MEKKVSIILPAYNAEKTIATTLESILKQTSKEYKIIIINDGSTDKTDEICREYEQKFKEVIEYYSISNNGVSNARNIGIKYADTKYVMFIDSDDIYNKHMVSSMIEQIEKNDVDLVTCGYVRRMLSNGRERNTKINYLSTNKINEYIEKLQIKNLFNQIWNKIYKLDIIRNYNIKFNSNISIGEDFRFNLNYIRKSKKMIFLDKLLYEYNSSTSGLNFKYQKDMLSVKLDNIILQKRIYEENLYSKKYIYELYLLTCLSGLSNIVKNVNKKQALNEIIQFNNNKNIKEELNEISDFDNLKIKYRIILMIIKSNRIYFKYYISKITIILKSIYRRFFIE